MDIINVIEETVLQNEYDACLAMIASYDKYLTIMESYDSDDLSCFFQESSEAKNNDSKRQEILAKLKNDGKNKESCLNWESCCQNYVEQCHCYHLKN